jgi:hypothetical protein
VDQANPKNLLFTVFRMGINTFTPSHVLHVNGVARSTQSTWATSSDRRAKHQITDLHGSLDRIAKLRPVQFAYTPEYTAGRPGFEGQFTGFIAQEVEPLFPDMVETVHEIIGEREVDDFRVLNIGGLTPHLVSALKELRRELQEQKKQSTIQIEQLTRKNASLESRLAQLEAQMTNLSSILEGADHLD